MVSKEERMRKLIGVLVVSSIGLTACPPAPPTPPPPGNVRFVHAAADAGTVDIFLDKTTKLNAAGITYGGAHPANNATPNYAPIAPGAHTIDVCVTGTLVCPIKDKALDVVSGGNQTVLIVGTADTNDDTGTNARPLELQVLTDTNTPSATATNFKLRIVHAAAVPSASKVDVFITTGTEDITGVFPNISNFAYQAVTPSYLDAAAGGYRVLATATGTKTPILINSGLLALTAGKVYTAIAVTPNATIPSGAILLTDK
jgi:hypothetical protein